jgi:hypothetical protein
MSASTDALRFCSQRPSQPQHLHELDRSLPNSHGWQRCRRMLTRLERERRRRRKVAGWKESAQGVSRQIGCAPLPSPHSHSSTTIINNPDRTIRSPWPFDSEVVSRSNENGIPPLQQTIVYNSRPSQCHIHPISVCMSLKEIHLGEGLRDIGDRAFCYCADLERINIPSTVRAIPDGAFWCCISLKEIQLAEGLRSIGNEAFRDCRSLTSITIPATVASIGLESFRDCSILKDVHLCQGLRRIGKRVLLTCFFNRSVICRQDRSRSFQMVPLIEGCTSLCL